jgi:protein SCO1/2
MRRNLILLSSVFVFFVCGLSTQLMAAVSEAASSTLPPLLRDVGIDQKLNSQVPLDLVFRDEAGNEVALGQYFGQKPVVLVLAYYNCPMLCTIVLNGVLHSVKELKYNIGREFEVVTVSFDPTEKPSLAAAKKAIYVGLYGRPNAGAGWHFLSVRHLCQIE